MKTVGIIGGVGPETTAEFYLKLIFSSQKKGGNSRPPIIISSVPIPYNVEEEFIKKNKGGKKYIPYLIQEAKRLEKAGSDFIVMPCNSLHIFIEEIRESVNIPVLSIIEETVKFLKKKKAKKVGIVSTAATSKNKLYESALKKNKIKYSTPNSNQQSKIGKYIINLVKGEYDQKDKEGLQSIINTFSDKHVDYVLLACTDLQLLNPKHSTLKIIDTMDIFANSTFKKLHR